MGIISVRVMPAPPKSSFTSNFVNSLDIISFLKVLNLVEFGSRFNLRW